MHRDLWSAALVWWTQRRAWRPPRLFWTERLPTSSGTGRKAWGKDGKHGLSTRQTNSANVSTMSSKFWSCLVAEVKVRGREHRFHFHRQIVGEDFAFPHGMQQYNRANLERKKEKLKTDLQQCPCRHASSSWSWRALLRTQPGRSSSWKISVPTPVPHICMQRPPPTLGFVRLFAGCRVVTHYMQPKTSVDILAIRRKTAPTRHFFLYVAPGPVLLGHCTSCHANHTCPGRTHRGIL